MSAADLLHSPLVATLLWSATTVSTYIGARRLYSRLPRWWTSPIVLSPLALIALTIGLHVSYNEYIRGTRWLLDMLGPVTVAFALPIFEHRRLIRRHWSVLAAGILAGSTVAMASAWALARLLGLPETLGLSLMPRSVSTPFAVIVSGDIGGVPDLTAVFVVLTGIFGAALGELLLALLPLRTRLAQGALFGMGAHGAGVARASQIGQEQGAVASLVMILAGLCNVLAAPLIAACLH